MNIIPPEKTEVVGVRIPKSLKKMVMETAKEKGVTESYLCRAIISDFFSLQSQLKVDKKSTTMDRK